MYKIMLLLSVFTVGLLSLSACNTVDGLGQDIENAGRKISDSAD